MHAGARRSHSHHPWDEAWDARTGSVSCFGRMPGFGLTTGGPSVDVIAGIVVAECEECAIIVNDAPEKSQTGGCPLRACLAAVSSARPSMAEPRPHTVGILWAGALRGKLTAGLPVSRLARLNGVDAVYPAPRRVWRKSCSSRYP